MAATKWVYQQWDKNYKREPGRNFRAEKYNNWIKKFTTGVWQQIWSGRQKNSEERSLEIESEEQKKNL